MTEWNDERSKSRDKARFGYALQGGGRRSQIMTDAPIRCTTQSGLRLLDVGKLDSLEAAEAFM